MTHFLTNHSSHYTILSIDEGVAGARHILFLSNVVEIHTKYGSPRSGGPDAINVRGVGTTGAPGAPAPPKI